MAALRRELTLWDATAVTIGSIIGSGIFFVPSRVAQQFPDPAALLALWVVGGLVSLAGALTVAELAAMRPRSGGPYVFVREAFGPTAGFVAGWSYFILGKAAINAAVLLVFAQHAAAFAGLTPLGVQLLAVWAAASMTFINLLGVRQGARANNLTTLLKVGALLALLAAVALLAPPAPAAALPAAGGSLSLALLLVLFAYNGWINATMVAEEVRAPERDLPRALALGTLGVMAVYLLANLAFLHALGPAGMAASTLVAAESMQRAAGWGAAFIAAAVLVSAYGNANGGMLTGARIPLAMAREGELPRALGRLSRHGVPDAALLAQFALTAGFVLTGTFVQAATYAVLAIWVTLALVGAAVLVLRRRLPAEPRPYRVPLYPWVPAVFLAGALFVVGLTVLQQPVQAGITAALMLSGLPLLAWQRRRARAPLASERRDPHVAPADDGEVPVGQREPLAP